MNPSIAPSSPALTLNHIYARYGVETILYDISGTIEAQSLTAVVGPNGGGKSTLLKVIMGFLSPYKGSLTNTFSTTAYLPQRCDVDITFPLTVFDIVSFGLWSRLGPFQQVTPEFEQKVMGALQQVGMEAYKDAAPNALSGGQLQRVFFARLCLQDASLILLDEPFTGIDSKTTLDLLSLILQWHKSGKTIIAVLHDIDLVKRFFPNCILLSNHLEAWGPASTLLENTSASAIPVCSHSVPHPVI